MSFQDDEEAEPLNEDLLKSKLKGDFPGVEIAEFFHNHGNRSSFDIIFSGEGR